MTALFRRLASRRLCARDHAGFSSTNNGAGTSSLRKIFESVAAGEVRESTHSQRSLAQVSVTDAMHDWRAMEYDVLENYAKLDGQRAARTGFPEVVYSEGKTTEHVTQILLAMRKTQDMVLATRVSSNMASIVMEHPGLADIHYHSTARILSVHAAPPPGRQVVCVLAAGTSDLPVAEEAAVTLELAGVAVQRIYDVGVAGIHRLLRHRRAVEEGDVSIVVAGMDGALPGVVGGLTSKAIVAVPTSVGYGAAFGGLAPLLTMLNACSPGVGVVNIDNGFGAAVLAYRILQSKSSG
ncbi:Aste57867_8812 [Aphanomyces stellatus]|uniref:phosphoribosylaminoimidazole carboxylase n=1 Tax=Aphanomyces stellatus TaxID=120398 RepID=A0A485KLM6_9STRA|nr:hypothetical protein As57867_008777 [Aphanomyces stellatus]VFT85698.1 Aste57867_8812 [Aphanomyces stellatus]